MKKQLHSLLAVASSKAARSTVLLLTGVLAALPAQAIINLNPASADYQSAPTTAPGNTLPWNNVGRLTNASGSAINGSVILIKGKYCLTANHVGTNTHVTFDGSTYYAIDSSFAGVRIGTADLKIFKLQQAPENMEEVTLVDFPHARGSLYAPLYIVGWGQGISPSQTAATVTSQGDLLWNWGGPYAKRWGTNSTIATYEITPITGYNYRYDAISTRLGKTAPLASEAGLADKDSGASAFTYRNNQWYLAGIAGAVGVKGSSQFGTATTYRDSNDWVNLYPLRDAILALIPDEEEGPDLSTFAGWLEANSLTGADAAIDADPDGDGIANLSEFAFGTNPAVRDGDKAPSLYIKSGGAHAFRYQLSKVASGISVDLIHSADLINWSPAPGTAVVVEDTPEYIVYELEVFPSPTAERFYTITVTLDD